MGHKEKSNMFLSSLVKSLTEEKLIGQSAGLAWGNSCWLVDLALLAGMTATMGQTGGMIL